MLNANREPLRYSAQTKKDAAKTLVGGKQPHSVPAVYLSHVALECALKRRILIGNRATHIDDLRRLLTSEAFDALFSGTKGHNLHHLGETASLQRYLAARGAGSMLARKEWGQMGGQRPYSLRYGVENLSAGNARQQVEFAARLADLILLQGA